MSHIKVITSGSQDFHAPVAQLIKTSSRGLRGVDLSSLEKRASSDIMRRLGQFKTAGDQTLIHLLAIGATEDYGPNRNGDGFDRHVCRDRHHSFVKNAYWYRDHQNKDPKKSYGQVKLSDWHEPMKRIELIIALNDTKEAADRNHGLVADKELEKLASGRDIAVSMACRVPFDVCSWCDNKAPSRAQYCDSEDNGGHCKAGGLKHNMGALMEINGDVHHLHAKNPGADFFDISHVFRPADRIAYVTGQLEKAANGATIGGAELAEALGITLPYALLIDKSQPGNVQRMAKLAYELSDLETLVEKGQLQGTNRLSQTFAPDLQNNAVSTPDHLTTHRMKFAAAMQALAAHRICLPLAGFIELTTDQNQEKSAATAEIMSRDLPGVFTRLAGRPDFTERLVANPYVAGGGTSSVMEVWAEKQASTLSLQRNHVDERITRAALRQVDTMTIPIVMGQTKLSSATDPSQRLAEEYALYKLAFLAQIPEFDSELQLTKQLVVLQNYVRTA